MYLSPCTACSGNYPIINCLVTVPDTNGVLLKTDKLTNQFDLLHYDKPISSQQVFQCLSITFSWLFVLEKPENSDLRQITLLRGLIYKIIPNSDINVLVTFRDSFASLFHALLTGYSTSNGEALCKPEVLPKRFSLLQ